MVAHPSGDFVYAADLRGRIYGYRVNRTDGSLAALAGMPLMIGGQAITAAIDPQGRFLYVGNSGDNSLYAYSIGAASGALTPVTGSPFILGATPAGVCFHPAGGFAYVSSIASSATTQGGIRVFSVDPVSGVPREIAGSPFATTVFGGGLAVHPNGNFLFDSSFGVHVLAIDPTTRGVHELSDSPRAGAQSDNRPSTRRRSARAVFYATNNPPARSRPIESTGRLARSAWSMARRMATSKCPIRSRSIRLAASSMSETMTPTRSRRSRSRVGPAS